MTEWKYTCGIYNQQGDFVRFAYPEKTLTNDIDVPQILNMEHLLLSK